MKTNCLYTLIILIAITTFQTYTMEYSLGLAISSKNPNGYDQLNLQNDLLCKIFAYCSHYTRCAAELTCRQFYCAASINNLNRLVMHDFVIGDEKEKAAFFEALINSNNFNLITPLLNYAKKEAELYNFIPNDAICITLEQDNDSEQISLESTNHLAQKKYLQNNYLNPLLKIAIEQENIIMMNRMIQEKDLTTDMIEACNHKLKDIEAVKTCKISSIAQVVLISILGLIVCSIAVPIACTSHNISC